MSKPRMPLNRIELLQGTLDLIILQILAHGPRHGYGIAKTIQVTTQDVLQVDTGSLYPALHRLEKRGWIGAKWAVSEQNQRVREYQLRKAGRRQLATERGRWEQLAGAMGLILQQPIVGEA